MEHCTCNERNKIPYASKFLKLEEFWNAAPACFQVEILHKTYTKTGGGEGWKEVEIDAVKKIIIITHSNGLELTSLI